MPTWRRVDGTCVESLALEVARQCELPAAILRRAGALYQARPCRPALPTLPYPSTRRAPAAPRHLPRMADALLASC